MKILFPEQTVLEGKHFTVAQDWEVPIIGFYIIAPKREVGSIDQLSSEEQAELIHLLVRTRSAMREALGIEEAYLFQNEDTRHNFHIWIFPRHSWMEKLGRKIQSVRPIMEYAKEKRATAEHIRRVEHACDVMRRHLQKS